jgi:hypothetical protein
MKFQEIGSNFYNSDFEESDYVDKHLFESKYGNYRSLIFPSLGRHSLTIILDQIDDNIKQALLPAFTCDTVVEPFITAGYTITYYNSNKDLSFNIDDFERKLESSKPTVLLVQGYFGENTFLEVNELISKEKNKGCIIIQDDTQTFFSDTYNLEADFFMASLRKWMGIMDGSFLLSKRKELIEPKCVNEKYIALLQEAFTLKFEYTNTLNENDKKRYKALYLEAQIMVDNDSTIYQMSNQSKGTFNRLDINQFKTQRLDNYNFLFKQLNNKFKQIQLVYNYLASESICPFYFPIFVENRKMFQRILSENDIFATLIWPKADFIDGADENTDYIYTNMIGIPCDQRYIRKDMERVVKVLQKHFF